MNPLQQTLHDMKYPLSVWLAMFILFLIVAFIEVRKHGGYKK